MMLAVNHNRKCIMTLLPQSVIHTRSLHHLPLSPNPWKTPRTQQHPLHPPHILLGPLNLIVRLVPAHRPVQRKPPHEIRRVCGRAQLVQVLAQPVQHRLDITVRLSLGHEAFVDLFQGGDQRGEAAGLVGGGGFGGGREGRVLGC